MKRNYKIVLVVISLLFVLWYSAAWFDNSGMDLPAKAGPGAFVVLELFTSQGCSSCPAADKQLREIKKMAAQKDLPVYTLSFHVDYWDHLGWKDTYSDQEYTARQYQYARALSRKNIYTPQMIANGVSEFVGSDSKACADAVNSALRQEAVNNLVLESSYNIINNCLDIHYSLSDEFKGYINIALIQGKALINIGAGENSGRTVQYTNIVRNFIALRSDQQKTGRIELDIPSDMSLNNLTVLVYLQNKINMQIVAVCQAGLI